ncbi:MAG: DUF4190 domain-containing protein [Planctomycetota bacterium]
MTLSSAPYNPNAGRGSLRPAATSTLAIWSLVLGLVGLATGILGIGLVIGIIGVVLGFVALVKIGKPGDSLGGKGMAIAGIITGCLSVIPAAILVVVVVLPVALSAVDTARRTAHQMQSMDHAKAIYQGMLQDAETQTPNAFGDVYLTHDLPDLVARNLIPAEATQTPLDEINGGLPDDFATRTPEEKAKWIKLFADFVIVPDINKNAGKNIIALFGKPECFGGATIIVRTNGEAEWVLDYDLELIDTQLEKQTGKTHRSLLLAAEGFTN